jgi:hypothetical protein
MTKAVWDEDPVYDVREVRIQAIHVEGCDPSLAGVSVYFVQPDGQWSLFATWDLGPFDAPSERATVEDRVVRLIHQILG